jgi:hypothetical protein
MKQSYNFEPYLSDSSSVPATKITPDDGYYVFTYFDVCPFSPSQRYLATTRLPFQNRLPVLGDTADVCVIDLQEQTIETVYTTKSWGYQTGALLNWGATDRHLYTNDVIDGRAVCVRIDLESGEATPFSGPMYNIAPDESSVVGFPLELMDISQAGYGAPCKDPHNPKKLPIGAATDEGIWKTDLHTNECTLLVSLADVAAQLPEPPPQENGTFYFWHAKFNRQSNRIMVVLRCLFPDYWGQRNPSTFTIKPDGSDLCYLPFTHPWNAKGGHANWHADSKHLIRNVIEPNGAERYCQVHANGTKRTLLSEHLTGGGHPSIEPTGRYVITDARSGDQVTLKLSDVKTHREHDLCTLPTFDKASLKDSVFRLDGHPVWNRDYNKVCMQAAPEGVRQLFIADLSDYVN